MANGLYCAEAAVLPATPKYRHDSNSENTPPPPSRPLVEPVLSPFDPFDKRLTSELLCHEILEEGRELQKEVLKAWPIGSTHPPPSYQYLNHQRSQYQSEQLMSCSFNHPPVKADCDSILLRDDRVLQNLLRNEER